MTDYTLPLFSRHVPDGRDGAQTFTEGEAEFLADNFLGRVATVSASGRPHVVPVLYKFDGSSVIFGGWNLSQSLKFKNILSNRNVAFAVDEVVSPRPWAVRGVELRGTAQVTKDAKGDAEVRITPKRAVSWGTPRRKS